MCIIVEHVWTIIVQFKKLIIYYNHGDFLYYFNKLVIRLGNLLITSYEFLWKKKDANYRYVRCSKKKSIIFA